MGRQINFYMEEQAYQKIVKKALSMGFVILYQECVGGSPGAWRYEYHCYDYMPNFPLCNQHFFYNPSLGNFYEVTDKKQELTYQQIKAEKLSISLMFAPIIEGRASRILDDKKIITKTRLYIRSNYYNSQNELVKQSNEFIKQYNTLMREIKKIAVKQAIEINFENPQKEKVIVQTYITDYLVSLQKNGYCIY